WREAAANRSFGWVNEPRPRIRSERNVYRIDSRSVPDDYSSSMCRNIKTLHNFKPPATEDEIRASALQFVRKLSGFTRPSKVNEAAFNRAIDQVTEIARELLDSLVTNAPARDREAEAAKARARTADRFQ